MLKKVQDISEMLFNLALAFLVLALFVCLVFFLIESVRTFT